MVVLLARALDVPLRDRNDLLAAAGYAPIYRETGLDAPALTLPGNIRPRADVDAASRHRLRAGVRDR
ncbi:MAG: hypothetical protein ACREM3_29580 [Candidatus Rokuibacteriota bacterium]